MRYADSAYTREPSYEMGSPKEDGYIRGFAAGVSSAGSPYDILNGSKGPVDEPALGPEIFEEYNSTTDG